MEHLPPAGRTMVLRSDVPLAASLVIISSGAEIPDTPQTFNLAERSSLKYWKVRDDYVSIMVPSLIIRT